jgi:hypothetical protein
MTTHELAQLGLALVKEVVDGRGWANPCGENVAALEDACYAVLAETSAPACDACPDCGQSLDTEWHGRKRCGGSARRPEDSRHV